MRLWPDLEPCFIVYVERMENRERLKHGVSPTNYTDADFEMREEMQQYLHEVDTLAEAQGITFLCPKCYGVNGGCIGTHEVQVTFRDRGVLDHQGAHNTDGRPTRWAVSGMGFDDIVIQPSILLQGGCGWHGFVGSSGVPPGCAR